ncbi:MAG: hypothetical protein PHO08_04170 [Methylococcales bacterium]|nr:hypothetical protein [Methylococcales bacterium]
MGLARWVHSRPLDGERVVFYRPAKGRKHLTIFSSSGGLFFDVPVILLSEDLIGGLAQETMTCGAMSGNFEGFTALLMPSMIDRI